MEHTTEELSAFVTMGALAILNLHGVNVSKLQAETMEKAFRTDIEKNSSVSKSPAAFKNILVTLGKRDDLLVMASKMGVNV